ncbi:hypothetical protein LINPERHAP1_LOCUS2036 [Linum perenne]
MWHRPDRVLRQFGMDQPLPTFDMPRSEVLINLETTQRGTRQADWVARYPTYIQFWEQRFDHEAAGPWMIDAEDWSFHGEYAQWYHAHTRRTVSRRGTVMETLVCGVLGTISSYMDCLCVLCGFYFCRSMALSVCTSRLDSRTLRRRTRGRCMLPSARSCMHQVLYRGHQSGGYHGGHLSSPHMHHMMTTQRQRCHRRGSRLHALSDRGVTSQLHRACGSPTFHSLRLAIHRGHGTETPTP